jgi:hypothetical protein
LVTSYLFYYIVVHLKTMKDKVNLLPFLTSQTDMIVADAEAVAGHLSDVSGHKFAGSYPSRDDTIAMCEAVNPHSTISSFHAPIGTPATQLQFILIHVNRTKEAISNIYPLMTFLDSHYVRLLTEIDNCLYFHALEEETRLGAGNRDLGFLATSLHLYFESVKQLGEYKNKGLAW